MIFHDRISDGRPTTVRVSNLRSSNLAACMSIEISIYCDGSNMEFVRTLKALADPLRLRVLAAVSEEELTVGEVQEVVASVQSSVSRNLAILRDAGFVRDRKEGTNVYFSVREDMPEPARELFKLLQARLGELMEGKGDLTLLIDDRR